MLSPILRIRASLIFSATGLVVGMALAGPAHSARAATAAITVVDADTGRALGGHIYLTQGTTGKRPVENLTGRGLWRGSRCNYASFGPEGFSVALPDSPCRLWIERGREYIPVVETFTGRETDAIKRTVRLRRLIDMNAQGWWSSDLHIHRGPTVTAEQMLREDVNVGFPLTWWNQPRFIDDLARWLPRAKDGRSVRLDATHIMSLINMEFEEHPHGAVFLLHLKRFFEGKVPPVEQICLDAVKNGGIVNAAKPLWKCSVETVILGGARMMEVVNNHYLWPAALNAEAWGFPRNFAPEWRTYVPEFIGYARYNCDIYYALLNCGYRLTAVGGTADGVLGSHVGYNRTYVYTGEKSLDLDRWLAALKAGHTFATNGPMLFARIHDRMPGHEVRLEPGRTLRPKITVHVLSPDPIDRFEIIHNGRVVDTVLPPHGENGKAPYTLAYAKTPIEITESGWIAVRAFSRVTPDNVGLAHTTPVWFQVGDAPVRPTRAEVDALIKRVDWWIDWAREKQPEAGPTYQRLKETLREHRQRAR